MQRALPRAAVQECPEEVEESEAGAQATSAEERQRQLEARHENIRLITGKVSLHFIATKGRPFSLANVQQVIKDTKHCIVTRFPICVIYLKYYQRHLLIKYRIWIGIKIDC